MVLATLTSGTLTAVVLLFVIQHIWTGRTTKAQ